MRYVVVLEKAARNWAVYSPDVLGCVAPGRTPEETLRRYEAALRMHLEGLKGDGPPQPQPPAQVVTVEV